MKYAKGVSAWQDKWNGFSEMNGTENETVSWIEERVELKSSWLWVDEEEWIGFRWRIVIVNAGDIRSFPLSYVGVTILLPCPICLLYYVLAWNREVPPPQICFSFLFSRWIEANLHTNRCWRGNENGKLTRQGVLNLWSNFSTTRFGKKSGVNIG